MTRHHRFLLRLHLQQIDSIDAAIEQIDQEVDADVGPFSAAIALLTTIPGVSELSARVILAEIGRDMSRFPTRRTPDLLGRSVPTQRRERRQAAIHPDAQGSPVA